MRIEKLTRALGAAAIGAAIGATAVSAARWPGHPLLNRAENQLGGAKHALEEATHDCGGHRVAAIKLIDQAMAEVREARNYANAHPEEMRK